MFSSTCSEDILPLFSRLKTVSLVVKHSQSAEALVKMYESKLYEEDAMNSDVKSIKTVITTLKVRNSTIHQLCQPV